MRQTGPKCQHHPILWLGSLCLLLRCLDLYVSAKTSNNGNQYYQQYKSYPVYCSDPSEMETRAIPPLPIEDLNTTTYKSRINRVTAIIRHGARTPIHTKNCWKGHWKEPDGVWDCQLTTLLSTRPMLYGNSDYEEQNTNNNNNNNDEDRGQFLVEKIYDAFSGEKPPSPYRNTMNGTCQDGQLIQEGYDQQIRNGQHLRNAYVVDDEDSTENTPSNIKDQRLQLFTTSSLLDSGIINERNRFLDGVIRYRSDDEQRTLASGQVLLSSMFEPEALAYRKFHNGKIPIVDHHTADLEADIVSSRRGTTICPKQRDVQKRGIESKAYKAFFHSDEAKTMRKLINDHLEPEGVHFGGLDCMMTSICTDRSIPDVINDYGDHSYGNETKTAEEDAYTKEYGPNRFERLTDYVVQNYTFMSRYNDSELSKMDMGPLWAEITESAESFSLFSGHDSTIYPLMASLGEKVWNATDFPAYASMMLIEIHDVIDKKTGGAPSDFPSKKAFRLVYNGNVLTWLIDGCPKNSHLCDLSVFNNRVLPFATRNHHGCGVEEGTTNANSVDSQPRSLSFWIGSMLSSFAFGSIVTFLVMKFCRWRPRTKHRDESQLVSTGRESFTDEPDVIIT